METGGQSTSRGGSSKQWSLYAGLYTFVCATAVALALSDLLALLADMIGLSPEYWMLVLASPAFAIGAATWWVAVERRGSYTYLLAGAFGLLTALFTGLLWTAQFVRVWGVEMVTVPIVAFFVLFVLGFASVAGLLAGVPLMYARRRVSPEPVI
jgi:hypothetical protein